MKEGADGTLYIDFGYLFWRVVRHYGLSPTEILAMPIRLFWSAAGSIDRLLAAEHLALLDLLQVSNAMGGGEAASQVRSALTERLGTPSYRERPRSSREDILKLLE
jgi:hypothetical protein